MKQRCLRAFLGSEFCWGRRAINHLLPATTPQESCGAKGQEKELGKVSGIPSSGLCPHPHPKCTGFSDLLRLSSILPPSGPLSFPQQTSPQSASQTQSLPHPLSAPSSRLLPSLSRPHLSGVGGPGSWPPPQPGCGSGGGGWLCLCLGRGVGAKGATGFGGVLAPADGGEVRVGGWAHCGRSGGGVIPLAPSLPPCCLSEGRGCCCRYPPTPPQRLRVSGAGQEVGGGDGRPVLPIASPSRPVSSWRLRPARARLGFAGLRPSLAPAASFFPSNSLQHTWLVCPLVLYSFLGPLLLHQLSSSWKFHSVSSFLLNCLICCIFPPTPNSSKNLFPVPNSGYLQVSTICQVLVSSPWLHPSPWPLQLSLAL